MPSLRSIGASSTTAATYGSSAPSAVSLQSQLERNQKQLSDCVNCASAKTPQGKADIQAISARISQIEQRIAQAQERKGVGSDSAPAAATPPAVSSRGNLIDVYA